MVVAKEKSFLCGVVEGFYGRPWTCEQRKELFNRMKQSSMNTYIYAPKDDIKHRALWRQPYTTEEESQLKLLIDAATKEGVTFVYAISPGLDISFSCEADITTLKRKMKQVSKIGCKAFALLFDDINATLKPKDAATFSSSAKAQASLTNELYMYMKQPQFLFCPTEYCKTRAVPTVKLSEYLNTLGKELIKEIDIMWTGDKVIPETISKESIQELGEVLCRKPVIWDNIHANDYDQRRVYLGGYHGRPVELYPYLNGILTNPNCEFEANYVAIHTLGTWCRIAGSIQSNTPFDVQMVDLSDVCVTPPDTPVSPSEDCEMPGEILPSLTAADVTSIIMDYDYKEALKLAIDDWIQEFGVNKKAPLKSYSKRNVKTHIVNGQTVLTAVPYELNMGSSTEETIASMSEDKGKSMELNTDDLYLLSSFFCLPYQHGEHGNSLLEHFEWLLQNVVDIYEQPPSKEKVSRWFEKLLKCDEQCKEIYDVFRRFCKSPNEAILYDLYPYLWDLKETVLALDTYVHWLSDSITSKLCIKKVVMSHNSSQAQYTKLPMLNEFIEPWHIKYLGGITGSLHQLLPFQGGFMYFSRAPDVPVSSIIRMRTFDPSDRNLLYQYSASVQDNDNALCDNKMDTVSESHMEMYEESRFDAFVTNSPKTFFLLEHNNDFSGYVAAVPNNQTFIQNVTDSWFQELKEKHKSISIDNVKSMLIESFDKWQLPSASHFFINIKENINRDYAIRRILNSMLSALKSSGALTVYYRLERDSDFDVFMDLGFFPVSEVNDKLLWRSL